MCRSIVVLRGEEPAEPDEIEAAARQYVRKVSGSRDPSQQNAEAFEQAVRDITAATARLLDGWVVPKGARLPAMPRSRSAARARAAAQPPQPVRVGPPGPPPAR